MILKKCYVYSFGKLADVTFDFTKELNVFKEDNGWGKSTLATFIKCIFYGLNDSKKSIAENERLKYKTWNTTQKFGGYIEFVWGDKEFKLERYFGNKQSEDTVSLIDLATGKSYANTENLGARIFQIDEEGFLSTTYFSQKDFQVKSNTSITAKFNSICESQDSDAFDKAILKLEDKKKTYKKTGDKGLIADTKREYFAVCEQIQKANLAGKTVDSLSLGVNALEKEVKSLKLKTETLTNRVAEAGKAEAVAVKRSQYQALVAKSKEFQTEKEKINKTFNDYIPTEQEINAYQACYNDLNSASAREKILASDIEAIKNQRADNLETKNKISNIPLIFAILACFCIALGIVFLVTDIITATIVCFSLALPFGVLALILFVKSKNKSISNTNQNLLLLENKISDFNQYKSIREQYESKIDEFLSKFNINSLDRFSALNHILSALKNRCAIDAQILEISSQINQFKKDDSIFSSLENAENLTAINSELAQVQEEYSKKATELAKKLADIKLYQNEVDKLAELEALKNEIISRQEQYKEEYEIVLNTLEFLSKADENLKIKYRAPLEKSLNKYLAMIAGAKRTALIDIDLNVTIQENGGAKQTEYYSKGEQNLFEICKRFALADVLFTGEKPFIILDDPFYNLDDDKLKLALELVKKLSEEYQILYFVCHESRAI